jgi:hypothetical protein
MHRLYLAFACFFRVLFGKPLPEELAPKQLPAPSPPSPTPAPAPPVVVAKPDPTAGALQMLALLQREGRLVDFLRESIDAYDDASIGVAVRDIHKGCRKVLDEHLELEPVLAGEENAPVTIDKSDPAKVRLVGNLGTQPPFKGVLRHHGWRAIKITLPTVSDGMDQSVLAPAEVELP